MKNYNQAPYYDDLFEQQADGTLAAKPFYRVLFKPGFAIQARELNQLQSILGHQISAIGNHLFKKNTVIIPGGVSLNKTADILCIRNGELESASALVGKIITNASAPDPDDFASISSSINAIVIAAKEKTSTEPAALYIQYRNSQTSDNRSTFNAGEAIKSLDSVESFHAHDTLGSTLGKTATVSRGVFYTKEMFVDVPEQTIIIEVQPKTTNCTVGLRVLESEVDATEDETLYDNAQGSPNEYAPGADRYRIDLELARFDVTATIDDDNFIRLITIENNIITYLNDTTQYAYLMDTLAHRTFDANGNFVVRGLAPSITAAEDDDYVNANVSKGRCYVGGYEYSQIADHKVALEKPRSVDYQETIPSKSSTVSPLTYFYVAGDSQAFPTPGNIVQLIPVSTQGDTPTVITDIIGTAIFRNIEYYHGRSTNTPEPDNIYRIVLDDLTLESGYTINDVGGIRMVSTPATGYFKGVSVLHELSISNIVGIFAADGTEYVEGNSEPVESAPYSATGTDGDYSITITGGLSSIDSQQIRPGWKVTGANISNSGLDCFVRKIDGDVIYLTEYNSGTVAAADVVFSNPQYGYLYTTINNKLYLRKDKMAPIPFDSTIKTGIATATATLDEAFVSNYDPSVVPFITLDKIPFIDDTGVEFYIVRADKFTSPSTSVGDQVLNFYLNAGNYLPVDSEFKSANARNAWVYFPGLDRYLEVRSANGIRIQTASSMNGPRTDYNITLSGTGDSRPWLYWDEEFYVYMTVEVTLQSSIAKTKTPTEIAIPTPSESWMVLRNQDVCELTKVVEGKVVTVTGASWTDGALGSVAVTGAAGQFSCSAASPALVVGQTVEISGTLGGYGLSGVAITGTAGEFSCSAATPALAVGQKVTITGTLSGSGAITGYRNPSTYIISATDGSTTFTLTTVSGAALTTTAGTTTGWTFGRTAIEGYRSPTTYLVSATNGSTTFTLTSLNGTALVTLAGSPTGLTYKRGIASITIEYTRKSDVAYVAQHAPGDVVVVRGAISDTGGGGNPAVNGEYYTVGSYYPLFEGFAGYNGQHTLQTVGTVTESAPSGGLITCTVTATIPMPSDPGTYDTDSDCTMALAPDMTNDTDITHRYIWDSGNTANTIGTGTIKIRKGQVSPIGQLGVAYSYYAVDTNVPGMYASISGYGNVPSEVPDILDPVGNVIPVRSSLDFRTILSRLVFKNVATAEVGMPILKLKDLNLSAWGYDLFGTFALGATCGALNATEPPGRIDGIIFNPDTGDTELFLNYSGSSGIGIDGIPYTASFTNTGSVYTIGLQHLSDYSSDENVDQFSVVDPAWGGKFMTYPRSGFRMRYAYTKFLPRNLMLYVKRDNGNVLSLDSLDVANVNSLNRYLRDPNRLPLAFVHMEPYTLSVNDVTITPFAMPGYQMVDIDQIKKRVDGIEYNVSLALNRDLDSSLSNSGDSNNNAANFGFWNEDFMNYKAHDYDSDDFRCTIYDKAYVAPGTLTHTIGLDLTTANLGDWVKTGTQVTLPYTEKKAFGNSAGSSYSNLNPFNRIQWEGKMRLYPSVDNWVDVTGNPPPVGGGDTGTQVPFPPLPTDPPYTIPSNPAPETVTDINIIASSWGPDSDGGRHAITFEWKTSKGRSGRVNTDIHLSPAVRKHGASGYDGTYAMSLLNKRYNRENIKEYLQAGQHFDQKSPEDWKD